MRPLFVLKTCPPPVSTRRTAGYGETIHTDDDYIYTWDEGVYDALPLASMMQAHVVVPYGEFDAYYHDEGDWLNYFVPGVGYIQW